MSKDQVIRFRIDRMSKDILEDWCRLHDCTPSDVLRKFVENLVDHYLADLSKSSQLTL